MRLLIGYGHLAAGPTQRTNPWAGLGCQVAVSGAPAGQDRSGVSSATHAELAHSAPKIRAPAHTGDHRTACMIMHVHQPTATS